MGSCPVQATPTAPFTAREPTSVRFTGAGTSDSLGICSGTLLVTNLRLSVAVTYTGAVTDTTLTEHQLWSAPVTTFPFATVFTITGDGSSGPRARRRRGVHAHLPAVRQRREQPVGQLRLGDSP